MDNQLEVLVRDEPDRFGIRTTSGPTPFSYRYGFASDGSADTVVHLDAPIELSGVAGALGALAARAVRRGVDAKLAGLKLMLEASTADTQSAFG